MTIAEIDGLTEDEARGFIERVRWPSGPSCVHAARSASTGCAARPLGLGSSSAENARANLHDDPPFDGGARRNHTLTPGIVTVAA
jgi:hypothetical protein